MAGLTTKKQYAPSPSSKLEHNNENGRVIAPEFISQDKFENGRTIAPEFIPQDKFLWTVAKIEAHMVNKLFVAS